MAICGIVPCLLGLFPRTLTSSLSTAFLWALFPPYHLSIWLSPYFFRKRLKMWGSISGTSFALPWKAISETSTSTSEFSTAFFHQWESSWARKYSFPSSNANHNSTVLFSRVFLPLVVALGLSPFQPLGRSCLAILSPRGSLRWEASWRSEL